MKAREYAKMMAQIVLFRDNKQGQHQRIPKEHS